MEKKSKHRPIESLKFVKFVYEDVAFYLGLTDAEIGHRIRDLIVNMLNIGKSKSEYAENRLAIKEALLILEATTQENDKIKELESRVESLEASRSREPGEN